MFKIVSNNSIEIGEKLVALPCSISGYHRGNPNVVERSGLILVNFYPYSEIEAEAFRNVDRERNIWAFDARGTLVWMVSPPTVRPYDSNPYTSLFEKDGKVLGGNWCGYDFEIHVDDGTVTRLENPGRPW